MNLPKQTTNIPKDRQALAPYNFIELPERVAAVVEAKSLPAIEGKNDKELAAARQKRKDAVASHLPDQNIFDANRHSGWIECELTAESPTYVRAPRTREEANKRIQSKDLPAFFYEWEKDQPVIPGSTLRGMLRSLVEIASFGKVTDVSNSRLIYRAVGDTTKHGDKYRDQVMDPTPPPNASRDRNQKYFTPLMRGGYIRKPKGSSDWYIQPAQEIGGATFARIGIDDRLFKQLAPVDGCHNAFKIFARVGPYEFQPVRGGFLNVRSARVLEASKEKGAGLFEATLAISGYMFSKRSETVVYPPDPKAIIPNQWFKLSDDQVRNYLDQVSPEQEKLLGKGGVLRDGQPVFYTMGKNEKGQPDVDFFGHCRMLRLPYRQSPLDLVPKSLRQDDIDLAEAIFGFTKNLSAEKHVPKERRYAGRVRISSARLSPSQTDIWLSANRPVTPQILGSPKPTTFQHYLVQTYSDKKQLANYDAFPATVIRGHKLYWHKGEVAQSDIELPREKRKDVSQTQTTQIQPVRAGVKFAFRIQFDNLSDEELGALLWVLRRGADEHHRLKLGMGKPLGMGAMKVAHTLRLIDRKMRYENLFDDAGWEPGFKPEGDVTERAVKAFENFVITRVQPGAQSLAELDRIKQLLAMLSWPGPSRPLTRYMEIERPDPSARRGKRNEYVERSVLPSPLAVIETKVVENVARKEAAQPGVPPPGFKRGTVSKWVNKGSSSFGFIVPDDGGEDVFVHINTLPNEITALNRDDIVAFKARRGQRGWQATEVKKLS